MSTAAAATASSQLWLVCGLVFVGLLATALLALFLPASRRGDAHKQARLDEVRRYRVLGVADTRTAPDIEETPASLRALRTATDQAVGLAGRMVDRTGKRGSVAERLERAGLRMRPEEWIAIQVSLAVAGGLVGLVLIGLVGFVLLAPLGVLGCELFRRMRTSRRRRAFEDQLPDALHLVAASLRAGLAFDSAVGTMVREGFEPVSAEFGRAMHEVRLGTPVDDALAGIAVRTESVDMELVVAAVRTAREVGGNLAEVLHQTAETMRERAEVRGQVRTLSAEGRFSAKILVALPVLMALYLVTFKRDYIRPLYSTGTGIFLLVVGCVLLALGSVWLVRLTKIEV